MAPIIYLVRHAQGYHNLCVENQQLPDPDLTPFGEGQCETLCKNFPAHDKLTHLVASPMRRTLYTCLKSFAPAVEAGKVIIALPEAQEISTWPSDVGSAPSKLKEEFGDKVDFSLVHEGWNDKSSTSKFEVDPKKLAARAREVRVFLRELVKKDGDDAQVVLVTHGGILHFITEDWDGISATNGTGWANTECRSYQFMDLHGEDTNATLKEMQPSWRKRRGSAIPLTPAEQTQLNEAFANGLVEEEKSRSPSPRLA